MTVIVLTGVSRGLGRAMAVEFARRGCTVFGCGRSQPALETLAAELGPPHRLDVVDVGNDAEVRAWAREVLTGDVVPDFLINNAAVINKNAPLWQIGADEFDRVTRININGVANTIRHFLPAMLAVQKGVVVNFSSGWGRSVAAHVAPYCASKWAVEGLTQALAQELPRGMATVPLNPGIINTEMLQSCFGAGAEMYPTAEQWAAVAVPFMLQLTPADNGQPLTVPQP